MRRQATCIRCFKGFHLGHVKALIYDVSSMTCMYCTDMPQIDKELRERAFTAYVNASRPERRQRMIINGQNSTRVTELPFRPGTLLATFFARAQRPEGLKIAEIKQVCEAAGCQFAPINRQLYAGVSKTNWTWDVVLQNETYYIKNVKRIGE